MRNTISRLLLLVAVALGCGGGDDTAAPYDPATAPWRLVMNHHAVTLSIAAPYDTIRLSGVVMSVAGTPIVGSAPVELTTNDSSVDIGPNGLITAKFVRDSAQVFATIRQGNVTLRDTILFNVTNVSNPLPVGSFDFTVDAGADSVLQSGSFDFYRTFKPLIVTAYDASGTPMSGIAYHLQSSDTLAVNIDLGTFGLGTAAYMYSKFRPRVVMLYADATIYGVAVRDSLPITITTGLYGGVSATFRTPLASPAPIGYFAADSIVIAPGGQVTWSNLFTLPIDVVFDDPSAVTDESGTPGTGNIPAFRADSTGFAVARVRLFPQPGVYNYHSTLYGTTGKIVVATFP